MIWADDKIKHYIFCYNATAKAPIMLRPIWGVMVFTGVSLYKELINDALLGKGTPDLQDVRANLTGVIDCILTREKQHNKSF